LGGNSEYIFTISISEDKVSEFDGVNIENFNTGLFYTNIAKTIFTNLNVIKGQRISIDLRVIRIKDSELSISNSNLKEVKNTLGIGIGILGHNSNIEVLDVVFEKLEAKIAAGIAFYCEITMVCNLNLTRA
jgi:hypothetical protein